MFFKFVVFLSAAGQEMVSATKFFLKGASKFHGLLCDFGFRNCNKYCQKMPLKIRLSI